MSSSADELRSFLKDGRSGDAPRRSGVDRPAGRGALDVADPIARLEEDRRGRAPRRDLPARSVRAGQPERSDDVFDVRDGEDRRQLVRDEAPAHVGARPSSTLQATWIDPEETPFEPVPRPGNPLTARLIAWVGVAAFLAGLGWLILPELNFRLTSLDTVQLSDGVLTAQPVQLSPLRPSIVSELYVDASRLPDGVLPEGTPIALLEGTSQDGTRRLVNEIVVPFDARFVSVDTLAGGVVMPGVPVATLYDPSQMYVIVTVLPELLEVLRRGMRVTLVSDVVGTDISGEVISAVPLLGTDHNPTTANLVNIRIKPDTAAVADLVPGIRFDAHIDLSSAPANAQPLVFTYAGHIEADGESVDVEDGPESDAVSE